ncbi:MAG TPA: phospholipid scramblase-related protein [Ilumatobacteraceae bacterium]|nr:phospholipid scramblase-related protein [Ilumatobacteraceae bacterium]
MSTTPANWYPDPTKRHQMRYWNGTAWTDHVSDNGIQGNDPVQGGTPAQSGLDRVDNALTIGNEGDPSKIQQQVYGQDKYRGANIQGVAFQGGGTIFSEPVLVVNQKAKIIELNNQYSVFDKDGRQIAAVNQVGQSAAKKALRLVTSLDQFMTHKLEVTDMAGQVLLRITRPAKVMKSTVIVSDGNDQEIGRIVQENMIGKINFSLQAGGYSYGAIKAENWRAWNFRIEDHTGNEVARITKTFEGIAKTMFTTADNYVVQIHAALPQPLNALVVASALCVDTALKQDSRGLG